ncbi:hypothetical protein RND71_013051 [Anisodus tanguticus]|uniref:tRNA-uridine aminocarboxypropyltransferase n=1 Tax=Anisodus tanguticus TaxID=243964 RepID=A0AAE1SGT9_9SOLA|nr:hypothetical protein RND71_013051 [Anisodus tanguticus]
MKFPTTRPLSSFPFPLPLPITFMDSSKLFSTTNASRESHKFSGEAAISLEEWRGWGTTSTVPAIVTQVVHDLNLLEKDVDADMVFGGNHGKLSGGFKVQEDKKHRAKYQSLGDSQQKLQFFSARQIACRVLGSRGYLCQKCWLPSDDCMCSKLITCPLWNRIRFWLYMHPKDFLRQNNTGKLLWQVFGVQAATLCLYGIAEHEEMMWDALKLADIDSANSTPTAEDVADDRPAAFAPSPLFCPSFISIRKDKVWCLYPNKNAAANSVKDSMAELSFAHVEEHPEMTDGAHSLNFILIDGTWSNSGAMFSRLKERYKLMWGEEEIPCIMLNTGASLMHKLRPQPSWDRTCTAAAAIGLLDELHGLPNFVSYGLDKQAEALEDAVEVLLEALTARRLRMGRSITRKQRHNRDIL